MCEEAAGWRWGQEGHSKVSVADVALEKRHPAAAVPARASRVPAAFVWVLVSGVGRGQAPEVPAKPALQYLELVRSQTDKELQEVQADGAGIEEIWVGFAELALACLAELGVVPAADPGCCY